METGEKLYFKFGLFYRSGAGGGRTPISRMEGIWKFKCRAETPKFAKGLIGPGAGTTVLIPLKSFWNYAPYRKELCIVISPLNKDSLYSIRNHKESASCYNLLEQL